MKSKGVQDVPLFTHTALERWSLSWKTDQLRQNMVLGLPNASEELTRDVC